MADSEVVLPGTGEKVDTRVVDTDQHRQVMVIGGPDGSASGNTAWVEAGLLTVGAALRVSTLDAELDTDTVHLHSDGGLWGPLSVRPSVFNGTTWDRLRGNTNGLFAQGNVAHGTADAGNPVKIGGKATSGTPSNVSATNDRVDAAFDLSGRLAVSMFPSGVGLAGNDAAAQIVVAKHGSMTTDAIGTAGYVFNGTSWDRTRSIGGLPAADANTGIQAVATVPHKTGYAPASATARYTATQTSTILGPTVGASQKMVVTSIQIQAAGTVAGDVIVYFGTGAYTRGTNRAAFDGSFTPSATHHPGYAAQPPVPYEGPANGSLRVTTSAAINPLTVTIWYYLVAV